MFLFFKIVVGRGNMVLTDLIIYDTVSILNIDILNWDSIWVGQKI